MKQRIAMRITSTAIYTATFIGMHSDAFFIAFPSVLLAGVWFTLD